jgi:plastocyanin
MRIRYAWIGILVALVVPALPAPAANQTVTTGDFDFKPASVTVVQGESVTWKNSSGGFHNVHFDDNSFVKPSPPSVDVWSVSHTFNTAGTFRYYCEIHGGPNGEGMSGTVTVLAPEGGPGPLATDKTPPNLQLAGARTQRVLRQRAVRLGVTVDEGSVVLARGTISVPGAGKVVRTKTATRHLRPRTKATLKLKLSGAALRSLRHALAQRPRLTAKVSVTARDAAGNFRSAKRTVKLKR